MWVLLIKTPGKITNMMSDLGLQKKMEKNVKLSRRRNSATYQMPFGDCGRLLVIASESLNLEHMSLPRNSFSL